MSVRFLCKDCNSVSKYDDYCHVCNSTNIKSVEVEIICTKERFKKLVIKKKKEKEVDSLLMTYFHERKNRQKRCVKK